MYGFRSIKPPLIFKQNFKHFCVMQKTENIEKTGEIVFVSMNKMGHNNYTYWLSGEKVDYNGWALKQPAEFASEHCVAFQ